MGYIIQIQSILSYIQQLSSACAEATASPLTSHPYLKRRVAMERQRSSRGLSDTLPAVARPSCALAIPAWTHSLLCHHFACLEPLLSDAAGCVAELPRWQCRRSAYPEIAGQLSSAFGLHMLHLAEYDHDPRRRSEQQLVLVRCYSFARFESTSHVKERQCNVSGRSDRRGATHASDHCSLEA